VLFDEQDALGDEEFGDAPHAAQHKPVTLVT
jgi:hypothetical protein